MPWPPMQDTDKERRERLARWMERDDVDLEFHEGTDLDPIFVLTDRDRKLITDALRGANT
jgi:hypothetical protein